MRSTPRWILLPVVISLALALGLALALYHPATVQAARSYQAERYDVDIAIQADGAVVVTETVIFQFSGGPFTYVYRDLAYNKLDSIDRLQASLDGVPLPQGTGANQVEIEASRPLKVTWHLPPTSDATHTFTLVYRVRGAIRVLDADTLYWQAIPEDHEYTILHSEIRLSYPPGLSPLEMPVLDGAQSDAQQIAQGIVFAVGQLEENESVTVTARFASGSLAAQPPDWQRDEQSSAQAIRQAIPYGFAAGTGTLGLCIAGLVLFWLGQRRSDELPSAEGAFRPTSPPDDLPPALAARLASGSGAAQATLFDLARRGIIAFEEQPKGWLGSRKFILVRQPTREALQPHEEALLQAAFATRQGEVDQIDLAQAGMLIAQHTQDFSKALDEEMVHLGWLDEGRKASRVWLILGGIAGVIMGTALVIGGVMLSGSAILGALVLGAGGGLFLGGLAAIIAGAAFSPLTSEGERQKQTWRSYGNYLKDVTRGREPALRPDAFDQFLGYAAAFGLADTWAKFFEKQGQAVVPGWYRPLDASLSDFGDFTAVISSAGASTSSADGGGGGGGGASGGGGSGAG